MAHDDPLLEEAGVDVGDALPPRGRLDDHGNHREGAARGVGSSIVALCLVLIVEGDAFAGVPFCLFASRFIAYIPAVTVEAAAHLLLSMPTPTALDAPQQLLTWPPAPARTESVPVSRGDQFSWGSSLLVNRRLSDASASPTNVANAHMFDMRRLI